MTTTPCLLVARDGQTMTVTLPSTRLAALFACRGGRCVTTQRWLLTQDEKLDPAGCYRVPVDAIR